MKEFHAEFLRPIEAMSLPDPRWEGFGRINENGKFEPITVERYAGPIQEINLNPEVPESVLIHFETAKNLALYAWNVYRFTPVAELYSYISIELALRDVTGEKKRPFRKLLKQAIEENVLSNEKFSQWKRVSSRREFQYKESVELAEELGLNPPEPPEYWDYLAIIEESIPYFRNDYAHGSADISPWPYRALEDSAELINQLYERNNKSKH